jgi:hypothetical protein
VGDVHAALRPSDGRRRVEAGVVHNKLCSFDFERTAVLLLIAAVLAILCRGLRLPYSVGLVGAGMLIGLLLTPQVTLSRELIFTGLARIQPTPTDTPAGS